MLHSMEGKQMLTHWGPLASISDSVGRPPFIGRNVSDLYLQIKTARLSFPEDESESELHDFMSGLMMKDPLRRLCLKDALKHSWLDFTS